MDFFPNEKSKLFCDSGMKCCLEGDIEKGLKYFTMGLELDGENILLLYNKANCLIYMGESKKAEGILKKVINLCDKKGKYEFTFATKVNSYIVLQDYENAYIVLEDFLKTFPNNVNALINMAKILRMDCHYEEAISFLDKTLELDPQNCEALMFKGEALFNLSRFDDAKEYINKSFEISTEFPYVWYLKGKYELHINNYEQALKYYNNATEMDPNFEKCFYEKAVCLIILGRAEEAKEAFGKIFDLNPQHYDDWRCELFYELIDNLSDNFSSDEV